MAAVSAPQGALVRARPRVAVAAPDRRRQQADGEQPGRPGDLPESERQRRAEQRRGDRPAGGADRQRRAAEHLAHVGAEVVRGRRGSAPAGCRTVAPRSCSRRTARRARRRSDGRRSARRRAARCRPGWRAPTAASAGSLASYARAAPERPDVLASTPCTRAWTRSIWRTAASASAALPNTIVRVRSSVRHRRCSGARSKWLCVATPAATSGWAICSSSARPPPSSSVVSRCTRQLRLRGPNRLCAGSTDRPAAVAQPRQVRFGQPCAGHVPRLTHAAEAGQSTCMLDAAHEVHRCCGRAVGTRAP